MGQDVIGVGSVVIDLKSTVSSIPKLDEVVIATDHHKHMGGPTANALATLQRLGMTTQFMGKVGDDEYGNMIAKAMGIEGIDHSQLELGKDTTTGFATVMVDEETKKRSIFVYIGHLRTVPESCIDEDAIRNARLLQIDSGTPAAMKACRVASDAGIPISVDADVPYPNLEEVLEMATIFIPAQEIAKPLVGIEDPVVAGRCILEKYNLEVVVVTLGPKGSVTFTAEETLFTDGFSVNALDTTGAGGVYQGGYLYGYLQGWPLQQTAQFANATAALMISGINGWDDIPRLDEVQAFLGEHGIDSA